MTKPKRDLEKVGVDRLGHLFSFDFESGRVFWKNPKYGSPMKPGEEAGYPKTAPNEKSYWAVFADGNEYKRSRVLFYVYYKYLPSFPKLIDHANGDSLDDRISNLREATPSQNAANTRIKRKRKHDYPPGVYKISKSKRFQARVKVNNKRIHLGAFDTPEQAGEAYVAAKRKYCGEFSPC